MKALIAAALMMAASAAQAVSVESATGDWNEIPQLKSAREPLSGPVVERLAELVEKGTCVIPGQSKKKLDMTVPFLVHFDRNGAADRIVLWKIGCDAAESVIGAALKVLVVDQGAFRSTGENQTGWYRSQVSFSYS